MEAIAWTLILGAFSLIITIYQIRIGKLEKKINWDKFQHLSEMQNAEREAELESDKLLRAIKANHETIGLLRANLDFFSERVDRLKNIVKVLRDRQVTYSVGITKDKTPDMDIRVHQYQAREELALELQKQGAIVYTVAESYRADIDLTEVKVTASINTLKLK
jgi:hypothetical protein